MSVAWVWLLLAGACEIVWAIGLKRYGFWPVSWGAIGTIAVMILSFVLLAQAMRTLPLGTAYAIWTGIGAVGTVIYGMVRLGEPRDALRLAFIACVLVGIIGLKWASPEGK